MDLELTSSLESAVSRLEGKEIIPREVDDNYDYYSSRLASSPAEAEFGDSPSDREKDMVIEDTCDLNWDEDANLTSPCDTGLGPIPLPPPSSFDDLPVPTRPETPNYNADLEQLFSTDQNSDSLGSGAPGVCGLCNLGNTCFMNSGLQCLLSTPTLVHFFLTHARESGNADSLANHLANLFQKVWGGKYGKVKPTELHQSLAAQHPQFKDYRQHDCQEFLALLLGSLHELLNTASNKSHESDPMTPRSVGDPAAPDGVDPDLTNQPLAVARCEVSSSSSRSSESSISLTQMRLRPLPEQVESFSTVTTSSSVLWQAMDSISDTCDAMSTGDETQDSPNHDNNSNLVSQTTLKRDPKNVNVAAALNNVQQPCFNAYQDIVKDAKTSNVNVLVAEAGANNQIVFDSGKFPKHENNRRCDTYDNPNLTEFHNFEGKTISVKRIKEINKLHEHTETVASCNEPDSNEICWRNNSKRFKMEDSADKEKNLRMEYLRQQLQNEERAPSAATSTIADDDMEADRQWEKHLANNQSVIVESFQGQFKSTVVCSECQHVSSTYEPFMYLSVPLPHAMEQQVTVTFVPASCSPPTQYLLTLNKQDKVMRIKDELRTLLKVNVSMNLELAEVLHHHIARIVDENQLMRHIVDPHRTIYAFEISPDVTFTTCEDMDCGPEPLDLTPEQVHLNNLEGQCRSDSKISNFTNNLSNGGGDVMEMGPMEEPTTNDNNNSEDWKSCVVCLEEKENGLKNHRGCSCYLCDGCIENCIKHFNDTNTGNRGDDVVMKCPVCNAEVRPHVDFVAAGDAGDVRASVRMLKIPVLFRQPGDHEDRLFGHPHLIKVASRLPGLELYRVLAKLVPYNSNYSIVLVDGQGYHCSRCMFNERCMGCEVPSDSEVTLTTGDSLAVHFSQPVVEVPAIEDCSLLQRRTQHELSLHDCLDAFSESETLDEHNPWYCPTCQRNQCATKTLSVWRYPEFLIVYLKRFVFHEYTSVKLDNKVSFPLEDLSLSDVEAGPASHYNLYAVVNHHGGASAGHYTAYARNPVYGDWNLFNDETVIKQAPQEDDFNHAYILFYHKQGEPSHSGTMTQYLKSNIEELIAEMDNSTWPKHGSLM